jgi:two-component system KDP operon response regulator KdpE
MLPCWISLPDMDGKDVLRQARAFSKIPIIVLSARDREAEKIVALDSGADDYVEKPFGIGELMARLRAALRHADQERREPTRIESAGLCIDFAKHSVTKKGVTVKLTPKEYDLLTSLARHAGRLLTHRQILRTVWGLAHQSDTQYLRVFIGQLRAKIEDDPSAPRIILTEWAPATGSPISTKTAASGCRPSIVHCRKACWLQGPLPRTIKRNAQLTAVAGTVTSSSSDTPSSERRITISHPPQGFGP